MSDNNVTIVTRHNGLIDWLKMQGVTGEVITRVTHVSQIAGKDVYGVLPLHLAAQARSYTVVDMPRKLWGQHEEEMTPEEMECAGAKMHTYVIRKLTPTGETNHDS